MIEWMTCSQRVRCKSVLYLLFIRVYLRPSAVKNLLLTAAKLQAMVDLPQPKTEQAVLRESYGMRRV